MPVATGGSVAQHRKDLGLSELRPSEMVDGLDAVAKRSERQEQVDRMKRRSGRITMNVAVHVDEKGRIWQKIVLFGIVGFIAAAAGLVVFLTWLANSSSVSLQEKAANTSAMLAQYTNLAAQIEPVPAGKSLSVEEFKQKLEEKLNEQLQQRKALMEKATSVRATEGRELRRAVRLLEMGLKFEDGFGVPFIFEAKSPLLFAIRSSSRGPGGESFSVEVQVHSQVVAPEAVPQ
jgi:hypothetical protein